MNKICCAIVYRHYWIGSSCRVMAKYEHEGKPYCLRHHPENVKKKRETKVALEKQKLQAESILKNNIIAANAEKDRKAACYDDLLAALQIVEGRLIAKLKRGDIVNLDSRDMTTLTVISDAIIKATGGDK